MKWKKYSDEKPRKEHGIVLFRFVDATVPLFSREYNVSPVQSDALSDGDYEWLDHLDDSGDGWIPVSERKPKVADGCPDGPMRGYVHAQFSNGVFSEVSRNASGFLDGTIIAWRRLPDPYVPPDPQLWESDEDHRVSVDAFNIAASNCDDDCINKLQRELRKRGYAIRKLEGE